MRLESYDVIIPNVIDHFPYGVWVSTDQRWKFGFSNSTVVWKENRAGKPPYFTAVTLTQTGNQWKAERQNNQAVLEFLGANAVVVPEILSHNPPPANSFMLFEPQSDSVIAHWNGLLWTVDASGHLATLVQPGTTPATKKDFTLQNTFEGVWGGEMTNGSQTYNFTLINKIKAGSLSIDFYLNGPDGRTVQNLLVSGKNISFTVPFDDYPMRMTGVFGIGSFDVSGQFTSDIAGGLGDGSWTAQWLKLEQSGGNIDMFFADGINESSPICTKGITSPFVPR